MPDQDVEPVEIMNMVYFEVPPLPVGARPLYELRAVMFLELIADGAVGPRAVAILFTSPEGEVLAEKAFQVDFVGYGTAAVYWPIRVSTDQLGTFWAEVRIGQQLVSRIPLELIEQPR